MTTSNGSPPYTAKPPLPSFAANDGSPATGRRGRKVEVYNLRYLPGWRRRDTAGLGADEAAKDRAGGWLLTVASVLLLLLAIAQGYVSFRAQYAFVHAEKGEHVASLLEALGLDCAAVIFALLALAQARLGRPAVTERALNLACVVGSLAMNAMSADATSAKSIAAWTLPAALYAAASDRLIAVVRRRALAGRTDTEGSPLAAARGIALWTLRLMMAPATTAKGFRGWLLEEAPVAPGRRAVPATQPLPALPAPATTNDTPAVRPADQADTPDGTDRVTPDNRTASEADSATDSATDRGTDRGTDIPRTRRPGTGARTPSRKPATKTATKTGSRAASKPDRRPDKARVLLAANPDMSGAELGRRLKVSDRTGRRLHARITAENTTPDTAANEGDQER